APLATGILSAPTIFIYDAVSHARRTQDTDSPRKVRTPSRNCFIGHLVCTYLHISAIARGVVRFRPREEGPPMCKLILFPVLLVPLGVDLLTRPASTHGAQGARSGDLLQPPLTAFQGVWSQLHYEASGQVMAERDRHVQLVIRGDSWETRQDGK